MKLQNQRSPLRFATPAVLSTVCVLSLIHAPVQAGPPLYRAEVFPQLPGHNSAMPQGMNEAGEIVGYAGMEPGDPSSVAVMTQGAALVELVTGNDQWDRAQGINDTSMVVGMSLFTPFKWDKGVGSSLPVPIGYYSGVAWDVNDSNVACGNLINDLIGFDLPVYWPTPNSEAVMLPGIKGALSIEPENSRLLRLRSTIEARMDRNFEAAEVSRREAMRVPSLELLYP